MVMIIEGRSYIARIFIKYMDIVEQKIRQLVLSLQDLTPGCRIHLSHGVGRGSSDATIVSNVSDTEFFTTNGISISAGRSCDVEINYGHPIQLHHVLLALYYVSPAMKTNLVIECDGQMFHTEWTENRKVWLDNAWWDLTKNYHDQKQSVKDFIGKILK